MVNIREFGAVGDRRQNDGPAIQAAIDACSRKGGGTVFVPAGNYLCGTVRLSSHVTIHLEAGATLWVSRESKDYPELHEYEHSERVLVGTLLVAEDVEHVAIVGQGAIHGQGTDDYGTRWGAPEDAGFRTSLCLFKHCRNVTMQGISMLYSDAWTVHAQRCDTVFMSNLTIRNNPRHLNSDGIHANSCRNVHIANCHIVSGDDCLVMKATEAHPCQNIVIGNCTLETSSTAIKVGTESVGDFRDIHVANCTIRNTRTGIGLFVKDGATLEGVTFSNLSMEIHSFSPENPGVFPIVVDIEKRHANSPVGMIRDLIFRDMTIRSDHGMLIQGMPERAIENLTIRNINFRVTRAVDYEHRMKALGGGTRTTQDERDTLYARQPSYLTLAYVKGLMLENIRIMISKEDFQKYERSAVSGHHLEEGVIRNIHRQPAEECGRIPIVALHHCRQMHVPGDRLKKKGKGGELGNQ